MASNDNFSNEEDFLLKKAKEALSKCSDHKIDSPTCQLMVGGSCPLLNSAMGAFKKALAS